MEQFKIINSENGIKVGNTNYPPNSFLVRTTENIIQMVTLSNAILVSTSWQNFEDEAGDPYVDQQETVNALLLNNSLIGEPVFTYGTETTELAPSADAATINTAYSNLINLVPAGAIIMGFTTVMGTGMTSLKITVYFKIKV